MLFRSAKVEAWGYSKQDARARLGQVKVNAERGSVRASGPSQWVSGLFGNGPGWTVSYELFVPSRQDLTLHSVNGGLHVQDVRGAMNLDTVNGGIDLARVSGHVEGKTVNGGVHVRLSGRKWEGEELSVHTVNGGVTVEIPDAYNASVSAQTVNGGVQVRLSGRKWVGEELNVHSVNGGVTVEIPEAYNASVSAQSVNGGVSSDFPGATITKSGPFGVGPKTLEQRLGEGGAPIYLDTVNGSVRVQRKTA